MVQQLYCINSDAVNRYGFRLLVTGMEKSLKEMYNKGMPLLIGHDFHRPIGWSVPFGIFIEPGLGRMLAKKMLVTDKQERVVINQAVGNYLAKRYNEDFAPHETAFFELLGDHLSPSHQKMECGCIAVVQENIARNIFAGLFCNVEKAGLVPLDCILDDFRYLGQGAFQHKASALCIFAHAYLRRSQSRFNNFYFQFIDELLLLRGNSDVTVKVRLDADMVGYAPTFRQVGELDYHWGPKYTDDMEQMKVGLCRHECNDEERQYHGISATEFLWKKEEAEVTFEMEELRDTPSPASEEIFHCRYAHSIYDLNQKRFIHFDGAMRSYSFESMTERVSKNFLEYGRKALYKKLFRIDGKLALDKWKSLLTHFYQGNPLIYEYFGLAAERNLLKPQAVSLSAIQKLLPYTISKQEGLRVFLSYHGMPEELREGRYIDILDVMAAGDTSTYCLEYTIHEVKVALQRVGAELEIPDGIDLIRLDDEYWNIPSLMHNGNDVPAMLQKTVEAYLLLFRAMDKRKFGKRIALTLSFVLNNRIVRISSYGHLQNQVEWLEQGFPLLHSEQGITEWVGRQRQYLDRYTPNTENYLLDSLLQMDGVLFIKRVPVLFPYTFSVGEKGLKFTISFPEKENDPDNILDLVSENKLRVIVAIAVESMIWEDTKENYLTSSRSNWMDENPSPVLIDRCSPLALYWASPNL